MAVYQFLLFSFLPSPVSSLYSLRTSFTCRMSQGAPTLAAGEADFSDSPRLPTKRIPHDVTELDDLSNGAKVPFTAVLDNMGSAADARDMDRMGKQQEMKARRACPYPLRAH